MQQVINSIGNVIDKIGTSGDSLFTNKEELQSKLNEIKRDLTFAQKEVRLAEAHGNWMQRSWRPLAGLVFAIILIYNFVVANIFSLNITELTPEYWNTFSVILGVFGLTRGIEKSVKVANNFMGRRNRREKN